MDNHIIDILENFDVVLDSTDSKELLLDLAVRELSAIFSLSSVHVLFPCDPQVPYLVTRTFISDSQDSTSSGNDDTLVVSEPVAALLRQLLSSSRGVMYLEPGSQAGPYLEEVLGSSTFMAAVLPTRYDRPRVLLLEKSRQNNSWSSRETRLLLYLSRRLTQQYDTRLLLETVRIDIAKRQKVDAKLELSEERFRSIFRNSSISLWLSDFSRLTSLFSELRKQGVTELDDYFRRNPDFIDQALAAIRVLDVNQATLDLFEVASMEEFVRRIRRIITKSTREALGAAFSALFAGRRHFSIEAQCSTLSGRNISTILNIDTLSGPDSHMALVSITDISLQKEIERRYLESTQQYRSLMETAQDAIVIADAETGLVTEVNRKASKLLGREVRDLVGMHLHEFHPPEDNHLYHDLYRSGRGFTEVLGKHELFLQSADGDHIPVEISASTTVVGSRRMIQVVYHDIRRRLLMEERRRLLATAVEQAAESVIITDVEGHIEYVNPAFEQQTGYTLEELAGENPRILNAGKQEKYYYKMMWDEISSGSTWQGRFINRRKDGTLLEEEATITPVKDGNGRIHHFVAVKRDITEQVALEHQVRQAQKMQAIGTLAGGIAHDFNNILTAIMGFAELSLMRAVEDPLLRANMEEIVKGADRAGKLIEQILTFSRQTEKTVSSLQLSLIVKEVLKLLRASLPANIEIITDIASSAYVRVDPTQMHQVIMNLCTNAYQAIDRERGTIRVGLHNVTLGPREGVNIGNLSQGDYVCLQVEDNGNGIAPEFMSRIFEPYFTTKKKDEGTGLGLSVVHGIVNDHGGAVTVTSTPGKGSCFSVYLPQVEKTDVDTPSRINGVPEGEGRVLLVDDERQVVDYEVQVLEKAGYVVTSFTSSVEALEKVRKDIHAFDLLVTDMAMPEMTGLQLIKEVRALRPEMPVLLCTGYSEHVTAKSSREMGIDGYLAKPFTAEQFGQEVKRVIEEVGGRALKSL
ncbi:PAS domain S-box protein [Desulfolithobacter sp.]